MRHWLPLLLLAGVADCSGGTSTPDAGSTTDASPASQNRDLDLLFVIDNSSGMDEEQGYLVDNIQAQFLGVLETRFGTLPNLHIGIVSSNMGVGGFPISSCGGEGDGGRLQNTARSACTPPSGYYISDIGNADGTWQKNYTGTLAETYGCIARLGTNGCGFEQHLESMKRALDGSNQQNMGFLRQDAFLAVIIIADEDDCSANDPVMFDPSQMDIASPLGPLSSFRCTEFGVKCDGANLPRSAGSYASCMPRTDSYVADPHAYASFLKGLKADPSLVIVGALVGDPQPFAVEVDFNGRPQLAASCSSAIGQAAPAVRIAALLDEFPGRGARYPICALDSSNGLPQIADTIADAMGAPN